MGEELCNGILLVGGELVQDLLLVIGLVRARKSCACLRIETPYAFTLPFTMTHSRHGVYRGYNVNSRALGEIIPISSAMLRTEPWPVSASLACVARRAAFCLCFGEAAKSVEC